MIAVGTRVEFLYRHPDSNSSNGPYFLVLAITIDDDSTPEPQGVRYQLLNLQTMEVLWGDYSDYVEKP